MAKPPPDTRKEPARERAYVRLYERVKTLGAYRAAHAIAGFQLADIAFDVLVRNGILPKSDAERLLKQAIAANRTQNPGNQAAAELLAIVLQNLSEFQPAPRH